MYGKFKSFKQRKMSFFQMVGRNLFGIMTLSIVISWSFAMLVIPLSKSRFLMLLDARMKVLILRTIQTRPPKLLVEAFYTGRAVYLMLQMHKKQKSMDTKKNLKICLIKEIRRGVIVLGYLGEEEYLKVIAIFCALARRQSIKYHASRRQTVTKQEKQGALDMAMSHMKSSRSTGNMIEIIMQPSHVYSGFHLVAGVEGSWKVGCRWTPSQCQISRGWSKFVLNNNLEEHDVCVFELLKKRKSGSNTKIPVFNVYIFRVVEEVVPFTVSRRMPRTV